MPKTIDKTRALILLTIDILLVVLAFYLSWFVRFLEPGDVFRSYPVATMLIIISFLFSFYTFGLYNFGQKFKSTYFVTRLMVAVILASLMSAVVSYALPGWKVGRGLTALNGVFIFFLVFIWRLVFEKLFIRSWKPKTIVIIGAGHAGRYICDVLKQNFNFFIYGFLDDDLTKKGALVHEIQVLGDSSMVTALVEQSSIDAIVVAITHQKQPQLFETLLYAKLRHVDIYDVASLYEEITGKIPVSHLREGWLVFTSFRAMGRSMYVAFKRYMDIILSLLGLVLASPILVVTAVLIKLDSKGSVFFKQSRVGLDDKVYTIYKFRSMTQDAEKGGAVFAQVNDSRVTKVGHIIRKARIDEIPQLWNVLKGDMSMVGPRPERPEFVEDFKKKIPYYSLRHIVKPGITGWAQVNWRYGASQEDALEKLKYDMFYLKNISLLLDVQIILKTINVVLFRELSR